MLNTNSASLESAPSDSHLNWDCGPRDLWLFLRCFIRSAFVRTVPSKLCVLFSLTPPTFIWQEGNVALSGFVYHIVCEKWTPQNCYSEVTGWVFQPSSSSCLPAPAGAQRAVIGSWLLSCGPVSGLHLKPAANGVAALPSWRTEHSAELQHNNTPTGTRHVFPAHEAPWGPSCCNSSLWVTDRNIREALSNFAANQELILVFRCRVKFKVIMRRRFRF